MDLSLGDMLAMQRELQDKYLEKWGGVSPEHAREQMLWMMGECGEVIDIMKKLGSGSIMEDAAVRARFLEEMADVMMYFSDVLLCYGVEPGEFSEVYAKKHAHNMKRDWDEEISRLKDGIHGK